MTDTAYVDYETRCVADLRKVGPWRYVADPSFSIIATAYAWNEEDVRVLFPGDDREDLGWVLTHADRVCAHNTNFDRLVARQSGLEIDDFKWSCTSARARHAGLPASLEDAALALGLPIEKDKRGKQLIRRYSMPQKDGTFREITAQARAEWEPYARRDVEVLRLLDQRLPALCEYETLMFLYDVLLNQRGVGIDDKLLQACRNVAREAEQEINLELADITGATITSVGQRDRILRFFADHLCHPSDLTKQTVHTLLNEDDLAPRVRRVIELRADGARTSIGKLGAMASRAVNARLHGMLYYFGAHTGRHSSVGVQLQNLPRPERPWWMIEEAIADLLNGDGDLVRLRLLYGSPIGLVADVLRSLLVPRRGNVFEICDLHAVELRGAAWIAGEQWILDALEKDIDVYCATAAGVYGRTISPADERERFLGKTLELAGQYGMGWARFQETCAKQGIEVDEFFARRSVNTYRDMHPNIVRQWRTIEEAARRAVQQPGSTHWATPLAFRVERRWLLMKLPSDRCLFYFEPALEEDGFSLTCRAVNSVTHQFERQRLWGSILFENAVQAICRDVLMDGCMRLERADHPVHLLAHDETVSEVPIERADIALVERLLSQSPDWASDLPLKAKGKTVDRYRKI